MVRWIGLAVGIAVTTSVIVAARIPRGEGSVGADVSVIAIPAGELSLAQAGSFLRINDMRPGTTARTGPRASVRITNIAGRPLEVRLRATPSTTALDDKLRLRIHAGSDDLLRGTLGALGVWSPQSIYLGTGGSAEVAVAAWLPSSVGSGYQGVIDDITLEFRTRTTGY